MLALESRWPNSGSLGGAGRDWGSLGLTPGKELLGLQVLRHQTGAMPGFLTMLLREIVVRFASRLFLGHPGRERPGLARQAARGGVG